MGEEQLPEVTAGQLPVTTPYIPREPESAPRSSLGAKLRTATKTRRDKGAQGAAEDRPQVVEDTERATSERATDGAAPPIPESSAPAPSPTGRRVVMVGSLPPAREDRTVIVDPEYAQAQREQEERRQAQAKAEAKQRKAEEKARRKQERRERRQAALPGSAASRFTLGILAIIAGLAGLLALRRPSGLTQGTLWGEDGGLFLADWLWLPDSVSNPLQLIVEPYAGQLWPLQRLLTAGIAELPVSWWAPTTYIVACLIGAAAIGIVLQRRAAETFGGFGWRIGIAIALVLVPGVAFEIQGNLANMHFYLAVGVMIALVLPAPGTRWGKAAELVFVTLTALTGLIGLLLAPIAIWMLFRWGQGRGAPGAYVRIRSAGVLVGAAVNVLVLVVSPRGLSRSPLDLVDPQAVESGISTYGGILIDESFLGGSAGTLSSALLALVLVGLVAALVVLDRRGPSPWWVATGVAAVAGGLIAGSQLAWTQEGFTLSARYAALLVFATVLVAGRALATGGTGPRIVAAVLAGMMAAAFISGARIEPMGPPITADQIAQFQQCRAEGGGQTCELPIAPEGWSVGGERPLAAR